MTIKLPVPLGTGIYKICDKAINNGMRVPNGCKETKHTNCAGIKPMVFGLNNIEEVLAEYGKTIFASEDEALDILRLNNQMA